MTNAHVEVPLSTVPMTDQNGMVTEVWHSYFSGLGNVVNSIGGPEVAALLAGSGGGGGGSTSALKSALAGLEVLQAMGNVSPVGPAGNTGELQFNKDGAFGGDAKLLWDKLNGVLEVLGGMQHKEVRITYTDSPYTVLSTDNVIYCDTDEGDIEVDLPAGTTGRHQKIINAGSSGNDVTVDPNGTELVLQDESFTLYDGENIDIHYNATEGWY